MASVRPIDTYVARLEFQPAYAVIDTVCHPRDSVISPEITHNLLLVIESGFSTATTATAFGDSCLAAGSTQLVSCESEYLLPDIECSSLRNTGSKSWHIVLKSGSRTWLAGFWIGLRSNSSRSQMNISMTCYEDLGQMQKQHLWGSRWLAEQNSFLVSNTAGIANLIREGLRTIIAILKEKTRRAIESAYLDVWQYLQWRCVSKIPRLWVATLLVHIKLNYWPDVAILFQIFLLHHPLLLLLLYRMKLVMLSVTFWIIRL